MCIPLNGIVVEKIVRGVHTKQVVNTNCSYQGTSLA